MSARAEQIAIKPSRVRSAGERARRANAATSAVAVQARVDDMLIDLRRRAALRLANAEALFRRAGG